MFILAFQYLGKWGLVQHLSPNHCLSPLHIVFLLLRWSSLICQPSILFGFLEDLGKHLSFLPNQQWIHLFSEFEVKCLEKCLTLFSYLRVRMFQRSVDQSNESCIDLWLRRECFQRLFQNLGLQLELIEQFEAWRDHVAVAHVCSHISGVGSGSRMFQQHQLELCQHRVDHHFRTNWRLMR